MINKFPEMLSLDLEIENVRFSIFLGNGFFDFAKKEYVVHSHKYYEFHHTISGSIELRCDESQYVINQNETYIVAPNVLHYLIPLEDRSLKSSFCFSFTKINRKTNFDLYEFLQMSFSSFDKAVKIPVASDHIYFLNKILSLFYSDKKIDHFKVKTYFVLLINDIAESMHPSENAIISGNEDMLSESDVRHFVAEEFVRKNFNKNISLSDLADTLHLSKKQTERIFYNEFGQSFKEYLSNMRLTSAKSFLTDTSLSVYEISEKVGYGTYNGFYSMFVNKMGISPNEYRTLLGNSKKTDILF